MYTLQLFARFSGLLAATAVMRSTRPVTAVFSLVATFCATSALRLTRQLEFRALVFLRVYVGAMAVLFLFVVRRLSMQPSRAAGRGVMPRLALVAALFLLPRHRTLDGSLGLLPSASRELAAARGAQPWVSLLDGLNEREALGQVLYTHYWVLFLVAGFVLLCARVAAMALVANMPTGGAVASMRQNASQQRSRSADSALFRLRGRHERR